MQGAIIHEPYIPIYSFKNNDERARELCRLFTQTTSRQLKVISTYECKNADGIPYTEISTQDGQYLSVDLREVINQSDDVIKEKTENGKNEDYIEYLNKMNRVYYPVITAKLKGEYELNSEGTLVDSNGFPVKFNTPNGLDDQGNKETIVFLADGIEESSMHLLIKIEDN